mmetsp:Transcript_15480/g.31994  ORF Transcript_15480/g.31994 Transcript_15480/m.31994 type:complete len:95 (-) Transcript_15480:231-515(-)
MESTSLQLLGTSCKNAKIPMDGWLELLSAVSRIAKKGALENYLRKDEFKSQTEEVSRPWNMAQPNQDDVLPEAVLKPDGARLDLQWILHKVLQC